MIQGLPCPVCGAWESGALCPSCGAIRGAGRVPLDRSEGDERWVVRRRGPPRRVLSELSAHAQELPGDASLRVAALRKLLARFSAPEVEVVLDFRGPEVGHVARTRRTGSSQDVWNTLPWLVLRAGPIRATLIRTLHRREVRTFRQGVERRSTRFAMDELRLRHSEGRGLRLALRGVARLSGVGPEQLSAEVPPGGALPPTAPGSSLEQQAPLTLGLVASLCLLVLAPFLLASPSAAPRAPRDTEELKLALASRAPRAHLVRAGALHPVAERRREALVKSDALPPLERWRVLRRAARDPRAEVRALALRQLAEEGPLGAATLHELQGPAHSPQRRLEAFRALARARDPRARAAALQGLGGPAPAPLRRAWLEALAELATPGDRPAIAALRQALAGDEDLELRAQAGWSLARVAPAEARAELALAFTLAVDRARAEGRRQDRAALLTLARALSLVAPGSARLRAAAADLGLPPRTRRALRRLL